MALSLESYVAAIESALNACLCLRDFPDELVEKQNKPEIEVFSITKNKKIRPLILNPIYISRSEKEKCLIEPSINSCRVSLSIKVNDDLDKLIVDKFSKFFAVRAESFYILRRKPLEGYNVSFLITNQNLEKLSKEKIIAFIIEFIQTIEKDINEIKLNIISQTRVAASFFLYSLGGN